MEKDDKIKEKAKRVERSAIEIINDLTEKALDFTAEKLEEIENKIQ